MQRTLSSALFEGVASLIASYGHSANRIAESIGLDPQVLYHSDLPISEQSYNDMLEGAALACDDQFFLLKLAQLQGWDVLGPVWQILQRRRRVHSAGIHQTSPSRA